MSQISLTASMRSNLLSLQGTASLMNQTQERLSSGKKVNSAIDNPSSYYTAQSLSNRASDLSGLLDNMGQAISTIKAANEGIESITSFVEQAKAIATSALSDTDMASRKQYGAQFNSVLEQIDALAKDSGYKGINLLKGDDLTVTFNEDRSNKLKIEGVEADYESLGLSKQDWDVASNSGVKTAKTALQTATSEYDAAKGSNVPVAGAKEVVLANGKVKAGSGTLAVNTIITDGTDYWKVTTEIDATGETDVDKAGKVAALTKGKDGLYYTDATTANTKWEALIAAQEGYDSAVSTAQDAVATSIQTAIDKAADAINKMREHASAFGNNYSIVQTREEFTTNLINVLEEGADKLTLADMNEESANMLALQTRQQLAINSLSLASQASQSVLRLFS